MGMHGRGRMHTSCARCSSARLTSLMALGGVRWYKAELCSFMLTTTMLPSMLLLSCAGRDAGAAQPQARQEAPLGVHARHVRTSLFLCYTKVTCGLGL
jgi:hypothetical protein